MLTVDTEVLLVVMYVDLTVITIVTKLMLLVPKLMPLDLSKLMLVTPFVQPSLNLETLLKLIFLLTGVMMFNAVFTIPVLPHFLTLLYIVLMVLLAVV
jgi:hypothetical protein